MSGSSGDGEKWPLAIGEKLGGVSLVGRRVDFLSNDGTEQHGFVLRDKNKENDVLIAYVDARDEVISTKPLPVSEVDSFGEQAEFLREKISRAEILDIVTMLNPEVPVVTEDGVPIELEIVGVIDANLSNVRFPGSGEVYTVSNKEILIMANLVTSKERSLAFGLAAEINGDDARKGDHSLLFRFASGEWLSKKDYDRVKELLKH
ncbi:hypothetical protein KKC08_01370 [Patescibacteria group bacterium]|nr:hypothetical protein [Patescibacteria group bacterium]MBU4389930.1 hypothetical protein [Patescibacteria group bacterium]MBU4396803.1 hypothetical protein [Patescibacteria group bacterium]MBU4431604.1 hypothetical protein [Patescibacteria group bacterium]MCG2701894.1 hypothetical protein [Candidatus Parcubacteria bacterium]